MNAITQPPIETAAAARGTQRARPTFAAVVPATDAPHTLGRCLTALRSADPSPDQVVVVDRPAGGGPAAARNAGAQRAEADVIVFVDADVEVAGDAFSRIATAFAANPGLVAVFGSYDAEPAASDVVSGFRNVLHHHVHQRSAGRAATFWTGLGAIRRSTFLASVGFDEARFREPSIEDIELGMRLCAAGATIELDPHLQGKHLKAWTVTEMVRTDFLRRGLPWAGLLLRARDPSSALNLGWRHRASAAASLCLGAGALLAPRLGARAAIAALFGLISLLILNRSFYATLVRRRGARHAVAGVALHALHHATGAAALGAALVIHVVRGGR